MKTAGVIAVLLGCLGAFAKGPMSTHPISWMHQLPVGEAPGWDSKYWTQFNLSKSNVWNAPLTFTNKKTGQELSYQADYEQDNYVLEAGMAFNSTWAMTVQAPYASRHGGSLDSTIDSFHKSNGFNRYSRHLYPSNRSVFRVSTNGFSQVSSDSASGFSSVKLKLKYWPIKIGNPKNCPCGLGSSFQVKVPVDQSRDGLSSGGYDFSLLGHGAVPFWSYSSVGLTSGLTYAAENKIFEGWPRNTLLQLYQLDTEFGFTRSFGLFTQVRAESPFMKRQDLDVIEGQNVKHNRQARVAGGYSGLVGWRFHLTFGTRIDFSRDVKLLAYVTEDMGPPQVDDSGRVVREHNAPDILLGTQLTVNL